MDDQCLRFEAEWKAGRRVRLEEYLMGAREQERLFLLRELLKVELHYRRRHGEGPAEEDYAWLTEEEHGVLRTVLEGPGPGEPDKVGRPTDTTPDTSRQTADVFGWPRVPGYEVIGHLGEGGMGVVYKARQANLDRIVALKMVLHARHAGLEFSSRLSREAQTLARLQHENIVRVYDVGEVQGTPFFSMEFVEGGSLDRALQGQPLPVPQAARLVATLALAVAYAHQQDVIHRDLKPANILLAFLGPAGRESPLQGRERLLAEPYCPKITDFGLAKRADNPAATKSGTVLGTPCYMAPEQARGKTGEITPAVDVWALGTILYECLTGKPPFKAETATGTVAQVLREEPTPPRRLNREVPRDLETICLKCLEKDPRKRYASAQELAGRLELFLAGKPIPDRPRGWVTKVWRTLCSHPRLSAAVLLLGLFATGWFLVPRARDTEQPRREAEAHLARGLPYEFEGHEELPGPFRWVIGEQVTLVRERGENFFSVPLTTGLLELVADPGCQRYWFFAEVRHDDSGGPSLLGLYFGHRRHDTAGERKRDSFYTLTFADRGEWARSRKDLNGQPESWVQLHAHLFEPGPLKEPGPLAAVGREKRFRPALPIGEPGPWRKLAVKVTPEKVEAYWEQEGVLALLGEEPVPAAQFERALEVAKRTSRMMDGVPSGFRPRSGLGLYIHRAAASFRRVVVEPITGGE
ncbi:MAG: serine/threonine protein kinase [Planctomycetes bacterium]|nr:serine/threonine protein kinase [Planctomycetota bacterium]